MVLNDIVKLDAISIAENKKSSHDRTSFPTRCVFVFGCIWPSFLSLCGDEDEDMFPVLLRCLFICEQLIIEWPKFDWPS